LEDRLVCANYLAIFRTCDAKRPGYVFNETCQKTVPEARTAFFESTNFEDALRLAISLGGDSDSLACITVQPDLRSDPRRTVWKPDKAADWRYHVCLNGLDGIGVVRNEKSNLHAFTSSQVLCQSAR
jgi:hypothetical protein